MSAITLIHIITNITFLALALITVKELVQQRDWFRIDVAMMFAVLALVSVSQLITLETGLNPFWLSLTSSVLLVTQPYLLLRMVRHFRSVARWVQWVAFGSMLFSWLALVAFLLQPPLPITLAIIGYFVFIDGYSAFAFFQDANKTGGVTRRRLFLASFGSAMIGGVAIVIAIDLIFPSLNSFAPAISQMFGALAALCYFLGFAPPRWMRNNWQYSELNLFLHRSGHLRAAQQRYQYLNDVCQTAMQTVGGIGSALALWSADHDDLVVQQSYFSSALPHPPDLNAIDLKSYWFKRKATLVELHPSGTPGGGFITGENSPQAVFIIPISNVERNWGVLLVYSWRIPVFAQDDLDLLILYADQAAIALTYEALLANQQVLIDELNISHVQLQSLNESLKEEIIERQRAEKEREKAIREQAAREEAEAARARFAFLAEASQVLGSSLDYPTTLVSLARLAVPAIADGCELDLVEPDFSIRAIEVTHIDPEKARQHRRMRDLHPILPDSDLPIAQAIRDGEAKLFSDLDDQSAESYAHSPEERELYQQIGYRSSMILPLRSRERILGTMIFFNTESDRCFTPDDLSFAEDLASRAGLAIDNAFLYTSAQHELSERIEVEKALRESQERLLLTTEAADVGMWSADFVTNSYFWDAKYRELMGVDPNGAINEQRTFDLMHPEDRPRVRQLVQQSLEENKPYEAEFRVIHADGNARWIFAKGKGIYDESGQPTGMVGVALDVTRRRDIETRTRENQAQIEVQHRLMGQREQERRKIAQDLHDGPLQELIALTFVISSALDATQDAEMIEQLEAIRDGLKQQIAELRAFASELRPPALERFGLDKAIDSHLETFQKKYPGIHIRLDPQTRNLLPPEPVSMALFRIYQEALNNVVRHSQATNVDIHVGKEDDRVTLEIHDNGRGFKLPDTWLDLARQGHLGLVGIHERAQALGGTARVYSNPGEGTTIRVSIPAIEPAEEMIERG